MASPGHRRHLRASPFNASRLAAEAVEDYEVGDRVTHDRHGLGRVIAVRESESVDVDFGSEARRFSTPAAKLHKL